MEDNSELNRFIEFQVDKDNYEFEKTILLQKDEIRRLKNELKLLRSHVDNSKLHQNQIKLIYMHKIKTLRREISTVPATVNIIKSKLISKQTKTLNYLIQEHHKELQSVRIQFDESMKDLLQNKSNDNPNLELETDNNNEFERNMLMSQQTQDQEAELSSKLTIINQQIEKDRLRSKLLQSQIDDIRQGVGNKTVSKDDYGDISAVLNQNDVFKDKIYEIENYSQVAESKFQEENIRINKQLQIHINELKAKNLRTKVETDTNRTKISPDLDNAIVELAQLEQQYKEAIDKQKNAFSVKKEYRLIRHALRTTVNQLKIRVNDLELTQKEHDALLDELKRLDFMVYGRNGKYQYYGIKKKKEIYWIGCV